MKSKILLLIFLGAFVICFPQIVLAQGPLPNPPADVPIDGGLSLVLAAGAGYLVKRRYDAKKKKAEKENEILP